LNTKLPSGPISRRPAASDGNGFLNDEKSIPGIGKRASMIGPAGATSFMAAAGADR
jgi:hypothetical protein